jgi:hypothetical protein
MNKLTIILLFSLLTSCKLTEEIKTSKSNIFGTRTQPNTYYGEETVEFNDRNIKRGVYLFFYDGNEVLYKLMPAMIECSGGPTYKGEAKIIENQISLTVQNSYEIDNEMDAPIHTFTFQLKDNGHLVSSENIEFEKVEEGNEYFNYLIKQNRKRKYPLGLSL